MAPLKVLITNNGLAERAGSELYVRDLAVALLRRGHSPIAYSTTLGDVAAELRRATVPVIDNLDSLSSAPDVIHGHHHIETMTALPRFPGVPAVYVCHGWLPWEETPPVFPRILRYVAVDHTCRDRLLFEHGIPEQRISVQFNFVDLERFKPRSPLPLRPLRALVFSNRASESSFLGPVGEACEKAGILLDVIGVDCGNPHPRPQDVLGGYDIVFAKAKATLEALAVGAAVILCDWPGLGPMVTSDEFDRLRALNFGMRALTMSPITADAVSAQISRYDPADAAKVSARVREEAGLESAVNRMISLYESVLAEFRGWTDHDDDIEERAAAAYLRWLSPGLKDAAATRGFLDSALRNLELARSRLADSEREKVRAMERARKAELERERVQNEIDRITRSLGWRVLSKYGRIKHRYILPALRRRSSKGQSES